MNLKALEAKAPCVPDTGLQEQIHEHQPFLPDPRSKITAADCGDVWVPNAHPAEDTGVLAPGSGWW